MELSWKKRERGFGPKQLDLFLDEEHVGTVDASLFRNAQVFSKEYSSKQEFDETFLTLEYRLVFGYTVKLLSLRSYPSQKLRDTLEKKSVTSLTIDRVLKECQEHGWINDDEWVRSYVQKLKNQGKSTLAIRHKLTLQGIHNIPETILEKDSLQVLENIIRKKHGELFDSKTPFPKKQKIIASLYRKGFSLQDIYQILKSIS